MSVEDFVRRISVVLLATFLIAFLHLCLWDLSLVWLGFFLSSKLVVIVCISAEFWVVLISWGAG